MAGYSKRKYGKVLEPGLAMMDFMAAEDDPASLLGKVNISAEAK